MVHHANNLSQSQLSMTDSLPAAGPAANESNINVDSLDLLQIRQNNLTAGMMKRVRAKLQHGVRIRHLDMAENELGDKGAKYLCQFLEGNRHLEQIDLSANKLTA